MEKRVKLSEIWMSERGFFTSTHLKIIACIAMLLSHIAQTNLLYMAGFIKTADVFMLIGRISMPIFCFLTSHSVIYSKDKYKYLLRLFIFALISDIPFDLAYSGITFDFSAQNVFFSLFLGALFLALVFEIEKRTKNQILQIASSFICFLLISYISILIRADYSYKAIFAIALLYLARNSRILTGIVILISFAFSRFVSGYEVFIPYIVYLSIPFILLYNGKRGYHNKWAFYVFYPAHLLLIYLLKIYLF